MKTFALIFSICVASIIVLLLLCNNNRKKDTIEKICPIEIKNNQVSLIPKRIVQTWRTHDIGNLAHFSQTWKDFNPNFTYTLFDDVDCQNFIRENFGQEIENVYTKIKFGAFRADFWRYCELYINGGVYIDIDTVCLGSIDSIIDPNATFVTPIDLNPKDLFNAFIAIVPKHPVMLMCINEIVKNVYKNVPQKGLHFSGPGLLGMCVSKYLGFKQKTTFVSSSYLYKGLQLLDFEPINEIVYNFYGVSLFQNKNKNIVLKRIYNNEANRARIVRYS
jgi:mannosyltransferase OCH1-like enzyme